ncbi:fungal hydrophobin [Phanerochaete sordida]|uniref:Hydrophobin n=1 Tax=Phanerochaete sordida TaxID=48140 RepID=A0A9P3L894_9APHY|nr:fungal hydrophobin [Phanerochaete sordida]
MRCFTAVILAPPAFALAAATAKSRQLGGDSNYCNPGPSACCDSLYGPESTVGKALVAQHGLASNPDAEVGHVGLNCVPYVNVLGGNTCSSNPVCCRAVGGIVSLGCIPVLL